MMKALKSIAALTALLGCLMIPSRARAEEAQHAVATALSSTTLSGYVDTSVIWKSGPLGAEVGWESISNSNPIGILPIPSDPWWLTNRPFRFVTTLSLTNATNAFFAGTGEFLIGCEALTFNLDIPAGFSNIVGATLSTHSRQVIVNLGMAEFSPISTNAFWPPFYSADGVWHFTGSIPLNETLRGELQDGQGLFSVFLSRAYWEQQQMILRGNLLGLLDANETNSTACWPRHPRSISARYTQGPTPIFPVLFEPLNLDMDRDGQPDYNLSSDMLCTFSIPSVCTSFFDIACLRGNELLLDRYSSAILEMGAGIGPQPPTNATWSVTGGASVTSTGFGASDYSNWSGPLGYLGEGYLGIRMPMADGWHYGWIRVHLPGGADMFSFGPIMEDWAFEPQPDTPILAGARPFVVPEQSLGIVRSGFLRIQIPTEPDRSYIVQRKQSINALDWENATYIFIATSQQIQMDLPISDEMGFYRVLEAD
jgi:hypothetical protein